MNKIKSMLAFAALMLCGGAWAAAPVAIWTDFTGADADGGVTKGAFTLKANGNTLAADGSAITIAKNNSEKGVLIDFDTSRFSGYVTVLVKYSDFTAPASDAIAVSYKVANNNDNLDLLGAAVKSSTGKLINIWAQGTNGSACEKAMPGNGYIAVTFAGQGANNTKGATSFVKSAKDSSYQAAHSGLGVFSTTTVINGCSIGGRRHASGLASIPDMKIEAVAIFNAVLTADDLAGFSFDDNLLYRFHLDGNKDNDGGIGNLTLTKGGSTDEANFYNDGGALNSSKCYKGNGANQGYILGNGSTAIATFEQGWTLSWWIKPNNLQNWRDVCGFQIGSTGYKFEKNTANQLQLYNNSSISSLTTPISYTDNNAANWIHVALVSNSDGESVSLYANGSKVQDVSPNGTTKLWGNSAIHGLTKVAIGVNGLYNINANVYLNGMVDEVAIYNFAASSDLIAKLASQIPPTRADLQIWKGESGDHKWNTAANWGMGVPADIDDITIALGDTIELDKVVSPKSLKVNGTVKGAGTISTPVVFADGATIDVTGNAEGEALTLADGASIDFGRTLKLVGVEDGDIVLKNITSEPVGLSSISLTVDGEASEGYLKLDGNSIIYKATNDAVYWTPNPAKKDANGIVEWTAENAWLNGTTPATWPKDDETASRAINVKFDPETGVTGVAITGPVYVGEVMLLNTGASSNQFDFHNSTKNVNGVHEITGGDTHDCLTASAINLLSYDGRLGLKVPIVGTLTFGENTKLVFKTAANGATSASTAYAYTLGGRDTVIAVEGDGEFAIPAGMYGKDFASTVTSAGTPTIVIDSAAEVTGTISGDGKVKVTAGATLAGAITCTGGLDIGANTVTINVVDGERTISAPITGSGSIIKSGAGTLIMSGSSGDFTGSWTVAAGNLKGAQKLSYGKDVNGANSLTFTVNSGAKLYVDKMDDITYNLNLAGGTVVNGGNGDINLNHRQIRSMTLTADSRVEGNGFGFVPGGHNGGTITLDGHTLNVAMNSGKKFGLDGMTDDATGGVIKVLSGYLGNADVQSEAVLSHTQIELAGGSLACERRMTVKDVKVTTATTANTGSIKVIGNIEGKTFMMPNVTLGENSLVKTVNDKGLNVTSALTLEGALRVNAYGATEKNTYVAVTAPNATLTAATIKIIGQDGAEVPNACATAIVDNDFIVMRKPTNGGYVGIKSGTLPGSFTPIAVFEENYTTDDIGTKLFVTSKSADGSFSTGKKNVPLRLVSNEKSGDVRALQFQILDGYLKYVNVEVKAVATYDGKTVVMAKRSGSGYVGQDNEDSNAESYGVKQTTGSHYYDTTDFTVGNLDAENFKFDGAANTLSGWFTSWGGSSFEDADKVIGPNGEMIRASKNNHRPWNTLNINGKDTYTISIYGCVDNVTVEEDENGVIFAAGNCTGDTDNCVALVKKPNGSVALVATGDNGGDIISDVLSAGYHLFTIVKEQGRVYSLYVDGTQVDQSTRWKSFSHGGDIQLAAIPGYGKTDYTYGDNAAYAMVLGFDAPLEAANVTELAKKYPYVATAAVTAMTASELNTKGTMFVNSDASLTFDTDITGNCAVANLSGEPITLTLNVSGDKKYVSAADLKKLQLDANVSLVYGWTAHKVISVNYVWKSGNTILAKMAEGDSVETVDGTLGGLVKRSTWNDIVIDQSNSYATDSAQLTKIAVDGTTLETISGVTATRYSRGTYRTASGDGAKVTAMPFMNGYLDDHKSEAAVSITVDGIPFKTYDVIVYFQTDGSAHPTLQIVQGEVTKNYRYNAAMELKEVNNTGTWGTGNYDGFSYAANVMRVTNLTGNTVKVTTNKASGERSSIAAIQIVQMSTDEEDAAAAVIARQKQTHGIFTWKSGANFHNGQAKIYSFKTGTDADIQTNMNTAQDIPRGQETVRMTPWHALTFNGTGYTAPGWAFRLTSESCGASATAFSLDASYPKLAFAGLIVEKGAPAFTFTGTGERQTYFGDNRSNNQKVPTYFEINENLTIKRQGETRFYGTETWTIADGKMLSINAAQGFTDRATVLDTGTAANVKILGGGQIAVSTLTASGAVTLDLSEQNVSRTSAVINGVLSVDGSTTIKLPATMQVGDRMKVASSISGELNQGKILLGSTATDEILWVVDAANGTIKATAAPAAMIDETEYDTLALAIDAANTAIESGAESVTITLTRGTNESAELGAKVTLDTNSRNYTGAVTGSGTIKYTNFTVSNETKASLRASGWTGTFLVDGFNNMTGQDLNQFGRTGSKVELKNVTGYFGSNSTYNPEVVISGTFTQNSGYSGRYVDFAKLSGSGKFKSPSNIATHNYFVTDWSKFTGDLEMYSGAMIFGSRGSKYDYSATIRIESGSTVALSGNTWAANSMKVEGTLKGTGTINAPVTLGASAVLDTTAGILNVTSVEVASGATIKLSTTPAGDVKIMNFTATKNMPITAAVTVKVGEETLSGYGLAQKIDGLYVIQQKTLEWKGASGSAITDDGVWTNGSFADNAEYGIFSMPAQTSQIVINVPAGTPDVSYIKIAEGGNYKFVGEGQDWKIGVFNAVGASVVFENIKVDIDITDITEESSLEALSGTDAFVAVPIDLTLSLGASVTKTLDSGLTLKIQDVPSFNATSTLNVDVTGLAAGAYDLVKWSGVLSRGHVGYGKPQVNITGAPKGWEGKLVFQATKISLLLRDPEWLARPALTIWPFGDSITEGYNNSNKANYRIQLFQKLELLGYNVKSVGWWTSNHDGQYSGCCSHDPTGTVCEREDWSYHSGVRSGRVVYDNGTNNVLADAVETGLDQAGDPDVVLLHIGTNDGASGAAWQDVYNGITNIAWRVIAARENTKVVMSTILPLKDGRDLNTTHIAKINQELKNAIDAKVFPEGRVYLADLWSYVPTMGDGHSPVQNYVGDDTHPDWIGHDKMANGWLSVVTNVFTNVEDPRVQSNVVRAAPTVNQQGVEANIPLEYHKGYRKLATMKPGAETHFATDANAYTSTESDVGGDTQLSKVAYYMELVNKETKIHRFVWVDMDAFDGATFSTCGFPVSANKQQVVNNIHVYANTGAIANIDPSVSGKTGFIEFSPFDYTGNASGVSGAPANKHGCDWNDKLSTTGGYGCFQIHAINPIGTRPQPHAGNANVAQQAQVLFAYNKWGSTQSGVTEIGIGNFSQYTPSHVDYTDTAGHKNIDASAYEVINIEFWGKVPGYVVPDGSEVEVEAETREAAVERLTIATLSEADAAANVGAGNTSGQAQYLTLQATRVGESNKWKVQAVVDNAKLPENKKIDDTAVAFANAGGIMKLAGATEKQTISIPKDKATAGLYYSVSFGTSPDNHTQESERVLATSGEGTVDIPVPALGNEKVYYIKVKASATR